MTIAKGERLLASDINNLTFFPKGTILTFSSEAWNATSAEFKNIWKICDGQNSTPNLVDKFLRGGKNSGTTGGADSKSFSINKSNLPNHTHTVNDPGHKHSLLYNWGHLGGIGLDIEYNSSDLGKTDLIDVAYTGITVTGGGKDTPDQITIDTVPNYYTVIYIMKIA